MNELLTLGIGVLLCASLVAVLLRPRHPEIALCLGLGAGAMVAATVLQSSLPLLKEIDTLLDRGGLSASFVTPLIKAVGVCLLTQLTADTCRDAGEGALATRAEWLGRVVLLFITVPLMVNILTAVTQWVNTRVTP